MNESNLRQAEIIDGKIELDEKIYRPVENLLPYNGSLDGLDVIVNIIDSETLLIWDTNPETVDPMKHARLSEWLSIFYEWKEV